MSNKEVTETKTNWLKVIIITAMVVLVGYFLYLILSQNNQVGATNVCDSGKYCADWNYNHTYCYDWDYRLCHINPSQAVQHNFQNESSCDNHLGTPHSGSTYDLAGVCPVPSPTPTMTPTPDPTATPTPTPEPTPPVCDQQEYTCEECSQYPNDDWCGEYKYGYCKENYSCSYGDDKETWTCDCPVEPTPTPTPTPQPQPQEPSKPEGCTHDCGVPACTDTVPEAIVNPHVYRMGDVALVKWYPKQGDKVNIYWRLNSASEWQHSIANSPNDGYEEVKGLGSYDWTFGVQSVNGCAADGIVNASTISEVVDGATTGWVLFR